MAIIASIISTFDPRGLNNARKSFSALTDSNVSGAKKQQVAMKLLGGALASAGVAAGAFAVKLGVDAVRAAIADEKSVANLNRTLKNLGQGFQQTQVENFITQMQFATGVSDMQLRPAMNQLLLSTNDVAKSQRMLELALNVSASTGKDLESVTLALSKASMGNFTALTRLGVPLDKTIIKNKDLEATLTSLENQFEGASAAAATTMAGKMSILTERIGEAQEALGYDLLTAIGLVTDAMNDPEGLSNGITNLGDEIGNFVVGLADGYNELVTFDFASQRLNESLSDTTKLLLGFFTFGPIAMAFDPFIKVFNFIAGKGEEVNKTLENNSLVAQTSGDRYLLLAKSLGYVANSTEEVIDVEKEEAEALKAAEKAAKEKEQALKDLQRAQERIKKTSQDFASFVAGTSPKTIQGSLDAAKVAVDDMRKEFNGIRSVTEQTADRFSDLSGVVKDELGSAFSSAEDQLQSAKEAFAEFRDAISGSITGTIDFASAIEDQDFVTGLEEQANTAIKFSEKVGKLLELGLSERALREVLETGAETGTAIADQIIAGGSTVVQKVNTLVASVDNVASIVGQKGAEAFKSAGVAQGQALVDGIKESIVNAAAEIAALASSLGSVTIVAPSTTQVVEPTKVIKDIKTPPPSELTRTEKIVKAAGGAQSTAASRSYTAMAAAMGKIRLADGGIVMGPTNALIGEAGPEAVIPLSGTNSVKMGTTYNITVNAGIGTNGAQVGREIVDAIKKFERTSGPVFASA